jgi:hypothetical protein
MRHAGKLIGFSVFWLVLILGVQYVIDHWPTPPSRAELRALKSCEFPIEEGVKLSSGGVCAIDLIRKRCGPLDSCFVDCFTAGSGVDIGGGCGHLCNYRWRKEWHPPEGVKQCYENESQSFLPI